MVDPHQPGFWAAVFEIILINILLSGDNAMVIALACRALPPRQRFWGMVIGAGVAATLLIIFTGIVATLMTLPWLKLVGSAALTWVAVRLVAPHGGAGGHVEAAESLGRAVRIVVIADIVMSLDNVIAIAAAAKGNYVLLGLGLVVSIPVVVAGSALIMGLLERFPLLVWGGAALLGWIAGDIFASDPILLRVFSQSTIDRLQIPASILVAVAVVATGLTLRRARRPVEDV
ncbi:MAG TPA: TerC family protein [Xanthobacteraceae bacterium]|nr:TerC family protein [Xanthobacteraceae bacterium]